MANKNPPGYIPLTLHSTGGLDLDYFNSQKPRHGGGHGGNGGGGQQRGGGRSGGGHSGGGHNGGGKRRRHGKGGGHGHGRGGEGGHRFAGPRPDSRRGPSDPGLPESDEENLETQGGSETGTETVEENDQE